MITILLEKILAALTNLLTGFTSDLTTIKAKLEGISELVIRNVISTDTDTIEFNTDLTEKLCKCKISFDPIQAGSGAPSPDNVRPISGYDSITVAVLEAHDPDIYTIKEIEFPNTVYGGEVDVIGGSVESNKQLIDLGSLSWEYVSAGYFRSSTLSGIVFPSAGSLPDADCEVFTGISASTLIGNPSENDNCFALSGSAQRIYVTHSVASGDETSLINAINGYKIVVRTATPTTISTTPEDITTLEGDNVISTNSQITSEDINTTGIEVCYFETVNNYFKNKEV